jgi:hypothetical protein
VLFCDGPGSQQVLGDLSIRFGFNRCAYPTGKSLGKKVDSDRFTQGNFLLNDRRLGFWGTDFEPEPELSDARIP